MTNVNWLLENKFNARPIVVVEDHVYHISELLRIIRTTASPSFFSNLTIVCLDREGPDTDAAIEEWLKEHSDLQISGRISDSERFRPYSSRLLSLAPVVFENQNEYCRQIARMIRPEGLLLQDIELETLEFVPRDRWWESTVLASTVRGIIGTRAPRCAFISNKRGYEATFGAELLAAGHDPRDVLNKFELEQVAIPFLTKYLVDHFSYCLQWCSNSADDQPTRTCHISTCEAEKHLIESILDVVLWPKQDESIEIGGKAFDKNKKSRIVVAADSNEQTTWQELIDARLKFAPGVEVQSVGVRVAPVGALRAETTNAAARHIHSIRKRLSTPQNIVTVAGHYRLRDGLSVGIVRPLSGE